MSTGLEGIVAAETVLSHVDGARGELVLRGLRLEEAARLGFEEVTALLWQGFAPEADAPEALAGRLGQARLAAFAVAEPLLPAASRLAPVEGLRLLLSALPDAEETPHHVMAVAAAPVFAAALGRIAAGEKPVPPDPALRTAEDFLRMLHGRRPPADHARALESYLITIADHGLNASTFAARVIASTQAGLFSSIVGALCALKGPLHGGAPGPVLDMLDAIGGEDRIDGWIEGEIAAGRRLMGFGHRVYKVRDPRADLLRGVVRRLASPRIAFAEKVETAAIAALERAKPGRNLQTNVEFYTALTLEAVGVPRPLFTPVFALGRMAGWTAHVLEQEQTGRLLRPLSRYVGPAVQAAAE